MRKYWNCWERKKEKEQRHGKKTFNLPKFTQFHQMYKWSRGKGERANQAARGWVGVQHTGDSSSSPALQVGVPSTACPALPPRAPVQFSPAPHWPIPPGHTVTVQGLHIHVPLWPGTPESHHEQSITHPLMGRNGQSWTETLILPNGNFSVVDGKTLLCIFFPLFNFIHELKWLWAVTNRFFTVFWTDGCSKNTSILAVSNSLDLPKQHCRLFVRRKEIKNCSHSPNFFLDY